MGTTKQDVGNRGSLVAERLVIDGGGDVLCFCFGTLRLNIYVLIEVGVGMEIWRRVLGRGIVPCAASMCGIVRMPFVYNWAHRRRDSGS